MNKEQLLDHYKNLYQIVKFEKDELERNLEEFNLLIVIRDDIIADLVKRIKQLEREKNKKDFQNEHIDSIR